jgi:hypothetical protein
MAGLAAGSSLVQPFDETRQRRPPSIALIGAPLDQPRFDRAREGAAHSRLIHHERRGRAAHSRSSATSSSASTASITPWTTTSPVSCACTSTRTARDGASEVGWFHSVGLAPSEPMLAFRGSRQRELEDVGASRLRGTGARQSIRPIRRSSTTRASSTAQTCSPSTRWRPSSSPPSCANRAG